MLTGHDTVNERVEATKAGAHNLVSKPPSLQDLNETLQLAEWRHSQA
jgi:FixJ family two-component response regulator